MATNCLIVDDEPLARKLIASHLAKVDGLALAGVCGNAFEAASMLQQKGIDLLFLDIQMPEFNGLQLIRTLKNPPAIILTTAHRDFAADAFDLDVVDYLLKPVSFERFLKAVNRYFEKSTPAPMETRSDDDDHVMIKSDRKLVRVSFDEIRYVESLDDHVKIFLADREITTRENISKVVHALPGNRFVRVHRSFIVSTRHIESVSGEGVLIGKRLIPFGRAFKQSAWAQLGIKGSL